MVDWWKETDAVSGKLQGLPEFRRDLLAGRFQIGVWDAEVVEVGAVQQAGVVPDCSVAVPLHIRQHSHDGLGWGNIATEGLVSTGYHRLGQGREVQWVDPGQHIFGVGNAADDVKRGVGWHLQAPD